MPEYSYGGDHSVILISSYSKISICSLNPVVLALSSSGFSKPTPQNTWRPRWTRPNWHLDSKEISSLIRSVANFWNPRVASARSTIGIHIANLHTRADLFRYCAMLVRGGVYLDIKCCILTDLESLLMAKQRELDLLTGCANTPFVVSAIGAKRDHIFQGVLILPQFHPAKFALLAHLCQYATVAWLESCYIVVSESQSKNHLIRAFNLEHQTQDSLFLWQRRMISLYSCT